MATQSDFQAALSACRLALDHGGELSGANLKLIVTCLEYSLNTLDTTNVLPPTMVDPTDDG